LKNFITPSGLRLAEPRIELRNRPLLIWPAVRSILRRPLATNLFR
jgi:hypothetical protein